MLGKGKEVLASAVEDSLFHEAEAQRKISSGRLGPRKRTLLLQSSPDDACLHHSNRAWALSTFCRHLAGSTLTSLQFRGTYTGERALDSIHHQLSSRAPPCAGRHLLVEGSSWLSLQRNSTWLFRTGSCNIHLQECNCFWAGTGPGRLIPAGRNSCSCEGSQNQACCREGKEQEGVCQQPSEPRSV